MKAVGGAMAVDRWEQGMMQWLPLVQCPMPLGTANHLRAGSNQFEGQSFHNLYPRGHAIQPHLLPCPALFKVEMFLVFA